MIRDALKQAENADNYYKINDLVVSPAPILAYQTLQFSCVFTSVFASLIRSYRGSFACVQHRLAKQRGLSDSVSAGIESLGGVAKSFVASIQALVREEGADAAVAAWGGSSQ